MYIHKNGTDTAWQIKGMCSLVCVNREIRHIWELDFVIIYYCQVFWPFHVGVLRVGTKMHYPISAKKKILRKFRTFSRISFNFAKKNTFKLWF